MSGRLARQCLGEAFPQAHDDWLFQHDSTPPHHTNLACTSNYAISRPANDVDDPLESGESLIPAARRDCLTTFLTRRSLHYDFRLSHNPLSLLHPKNYSRPPRPVHRYPLDTKDVLRWVGLEVRYTRDNASCRVENGSRKALRYVFGKARHRARGTKGTKDAREGNGAGLGRWQRTLKCRLSALNWLP